MTITTIDPLQYPIGKFNIPVSYTSEDFTTWMNDIKELPGKLHQAIIGLNETQLDTPYRPGGWTLRQVVHHLADSHMNALMRFKWTLTEEAPIIKSYDRNSWAMQADYKLPVEPSLIMLEGIHQHLVALFESFNEEQWDRYFTDPETDQQVPLKRILARYSWHCKHHLAHVTNTVATF